MSAGQTLVNMRAWSAAELCLRRCPALDGAWLGAATTVVVSLEGPTRRLAGRRQEALSCGACPPRPLEKLAALLRLALATSPEYPTRPDLHARRPWRTTGSKPSSRRRLMQDA